MHTIVIAIITYKRPEALVNCIRSLKNIIIPENAEVSLLVVDNDIERSAAEIVFELTPEFPFEVEYIVEENKGIPHARNKVLSHCKNKDYIAFIDDDETAEREWLKCLYNTAIKYDADIVQGLINYQFEEGFEHLSNIDIFANHAAATGEILDTAWTNNVLFSTKVYKNLGLRFDTSFSKRGGSDRHFFCYACSINKKIVMCREAIVNAPITGSRTSWKWIAMRNIRVGANITISNIILNGYSFAIRQVTASVKDSMGYFIRLMRGVRSGRNKFIHPFMVLMFMLGRIIGIFKLSPREYK